MSRLSVANLHFEVRRSPRRKTLQLTVDRDGSLLVAAPVGASDEALEAFAREKLEWVYRKRAEKEALPQDGGTKQYVSGEGFPYLGRSYRLLLVDEQDVPVKLEEGRFKLRRLDATNGRHHMIQWYTAHAVPWLTRRLERWAPRLDVQPTGLNVRDLRYRWGSCNVKGAINIHWRTILLSPRLIDYILVHELVHLAEPHHTAAFWRRVERALPDVLERRAAVAQAGPTALVV